MEEHHTTFGEVLRQLVHPANLRISTGFRKALREMPAQQAAQWIMKECNVETFIQSGTFPSQGPLVVIGNSSSPLGGVAAIANIDRSDLGVLGTTIQVADDVNATETRLYLLYLSGQPNANPFARFRNNYLQPRLEGIDRDEAALRNAISIRRAAQRVDRGGSLLFGPMGGTFFNKKDWKTGIGAVVKSIHNPETQVVFVRLHGGKSSHLFRLLNPYWFWAFRKRDQVRLQIEPPIPLAEFTGEASSAEAISERIKQRYIQVCGPL